MKGHKMNFAYKLHRFLFIIFLTLGTPYGLAVAEENTFLSNFQGEWQSDGDAFGQPAHSVMTWSLDLNDKFYRLNYNIITGTTPLLTGVAYYKETGAGQLKAFWADSTGDLHPITATFDGSALVSIWGVEGEKLGRTRYELISPNQIQVTDWIMKDSDWRQFNQNVFSKVE